MTTPFGLYDCDVPVDGAVAVVVSAVETAADRPRPPVLVEAVGTQILERLSWDQDTLSREPADQGPVRHLWTRTDLRPDEVDVALLYDGFTFNAVSWLWPARRLRGRGTMPNVCDMILRCAGLSAAGRCWAARLRQARWGASRRNGLRPIRTFLP